MSYTIKQNITMVRYVRTKELEKAIRDYLKEPHWLIHNDSELNSGTSQYLLGHISQAVSVYHKRMNLSICIGVYVYVCVCVYLELTDYLDLLSVGFDRFRVAVKYISVTAFGMRTALEALHQTRFATVPGTDKLNLEEIVKVVFGLQIG